MSKVHWGNKVYRRWHWYRFYRVLRHWYRQKRGKRSIKALLRHHSDMQNRITNYLGNYSNGIDHRNWITSIAHSILKNHYNSAHGWVKVNHSNRYQMRMLLQRTEMRLCSRWQNVLNMLQFSRSYVKNAVCRLQQRKNRKRKASNYLQSVWQSQLWTNHQEKMVCEGSSRANQEHWVYRILKPHHYHILWQKSKNMELTHRPVHRFITAKLHQKVTRTDRLLGW